MLQLSAATVLASTCIAHVRLLAPGSLNVGCIFIVGRDEKEIKRLVKEGADPNYPDCDMLSFR